MPPVDFVGFGENTTRLERELPAPALLKSLSTCNYDARCFQLALELTSA